MQCLCISGVCSHHSFLRMSTQAHRTRMAVPSPSAARAWLCLFAAAWSLSQHHYLCSESRTVGVKSNEQQNGVTVKTNHQAQGSSWIPNTVSDMSRTRKSGWKRRGCFEGSWTSLGQNQPAVCPGCEHQRSGDFESRGVHFESTGTGHEPRQGGTVNSTYTGLAPVHTASKALDTPGVSTESEVGCFLRSAGPLSTCPPFLKTLSGSRAPPPTHTSEV